jgi:hypothetical protein
VIDTFDVKSRCPKGKRMNADAKAMPYVPPALRVLGSVQELTQGCDKHMGGSDGFTYNGQAIVCRSG